MAITVHVRHKDSPTKRMVVGWKEWNLKSVE